MTYAVLLCDNLFTFAQKFNRMNKVSENPFKNRTDSQTMLVIVSSLFVTMYLVSNIMAVKVIGFFNLFYFDAGTITFPFAYMLGDVIISLETAARQANEYGHSLEREVGFLTVHSMLHLLGYDHVNDKLEARIMREKEETILSELGISRDTSFVIEHDENPH